MQWVDADITDFFALQDAFEGVSKVYHCAAMVSYQKADRKEMMAINVQGTANVVALAMDQGARLLHVSSIAALGRAKDGRETTEKDLWEYSADQSGYAVAKYEAEMEVWRGIAEGLDAVIVNPALIIGPSAGTSGSGAIFGMLQKGLKFYTGGSVGLIDVADVAKAMILLMDDTTIHDERYLLSNVNMAHKELLEKCSGYLHRPAPRIQATPLMLGLAWRAAKFLSFFTGKAPLLTKESARASSRKMRFSNKKVVDATGITFKPIDDTLREICASLLTTP